MKKVGLSGYGMGYPPHSRLRRPTSCPLILLGTRASPTFRRQVCSRGKLGILNLGYEYYLAIPDPPDHLFTIRHRQTGYA
ncbi:MAG: hypothetical protein OXE87_12095 [Chloroflexi bacterium]|nr:hypothetical protein [Chloroflexota bacterium]